jgi:hypothetical protein
MSRVLVRRGAQVYLQRVHEPARYVSRKLAIEFNGRFWSAAELARATGLHPETIRSRWHAGLRGGALVH